MLRCWHAEDLTDFVIDRRISLVVFAEHLKIHMQGRPAHAKIRLPLQLHFAAAYVKCGLGAFVVEGYCSGFRIHMFHRHIKHAARFG